MIFKCTPTNPYNSIIHHEPRIRVEHEGAREIDSTDYTITMECKDCKTKWTAELPE